MNAELKPSLNAALNAALKPWLKAALNTGSHAACVGVCERGLGSVAADAIRAASLTACAPVTPWCPRAA